MNSTDVLEIKETSGGPGIRQLVLAGKFSVSSAMDFKKAMDSQLQKHPQQISVEMSRVQYLSSAALGMFIFFSKKLTAAGVDFSLQNPSSTVINSLKILELDHLVS